VLGSIPRGRNATGATEAFFKITYNIKRLCAGGDFLHKC